MTKFINAFDLAIVMLYWKDPNLGQARTCGGVKPVNGFPILS